MRPEQEQGFHISVDGTKAIVKIRFWGFWDMELAEQYRKKFEEQIRKINASEKEWYLLIDVMNYPSQLPEVQHIIDEGLALLEAHNIAKRAILVNGAITRFQTEALTGGTGIHIYSYFRTEDDAIRWLLNP